MGVQTKKFGRFAWIVLETLACAYDECFENKIPSIRAMRCDFACLLYLLGFLLPCVYCRVSYREFTNKGNPDTDIDRMLKLGKARLLVYNLHEMVNEKLYQQAVYENKPVVRTRIAFEDVPLRSIDSFCFWESLLVFLGYVMCDYREEWKSYMCDFLTHLDHMIQVASPNKPFHKSVTSMEKEWTTLESRLRDVWDLMAPVAKSRKWKFAVTWSGYKKICVSGIVAKCGTKKE